MSTRPAPHAGMGVAQYTWATSPLRRYVDLLNQWQIIACARHGATAALAAPFKPKDATLFSVISSFDTAYGAYNDFQRSMERYWSLRWLQQHGIEELLATVMRDGLVRADTLPLVFRVPGCDECPRGAKVRARITGRRSLRTTLTGRMPGKHCVRWLRDVRNPICGTQLAHHTQGLTATRDAHSSSILPITWARAPGRRRSALVTTTWYGARASSSMSSTRRSSAPRPRRQSTKTFQ